MTSRLPIIGIALAAIGMTVCGPSAACTWLPVTYVTKDGKPPSERFLAARRKADARREAAYRLAELRKDVRTGRVDPAIALADLLIPNIRETKISTDSCGRAIDERAVDLSPEAQSDLWFKGTELEGIDLEHVPAAFRRALWGGYADACNVEFRAGFANVLRKRVRRSMLDSAYVTLTQRRGGVFSRYYVMASDRLAPPVLAQYPLYPGLWPHFRDILGPSRPISRAVADFWVENSARMAADAAACPVARRTYFATRDAEFTKLRADPYYPKLLLWAQRGRDARAKPAPVETVK